jgi:hypothetical protein
MLNFAEGLGIPAIPGNPCAAAWTRGAGYQYTYAAFVHIALGQRREWRAAGDVRENPYTNLRSRYSVPCPRIGPEASACSQMLFQPQF